jgi:hypothetical protein
MEGHAVSDHYCTCPHPSHKNKALNKLKEAWNENPVLVIGVIGGALAGAGKFIDSISAVQGRRAYAKHAKLRAQKK